ncbi:MAG: helix-turn-helix domain-containing protein [Candidatus Limnocylindrales bacterium]
METTMRTSGLDLKLLRIALGLTVREVAHVAGCSRTYVNRIEAAGRPSDRACAKYLDALAQVSDRIAPDYATAIRAATAALAAAVRVGVRAEAAGQQSAPSAPGPRPAVKKEMASRGI